MTNVRMHLKGGLGNQLFILAAGIRISKLRESQELTLDTSFLDGDLLRSYALGPYTLPRATSLSSGGLHRLVHKPEISRIFKTLNTRYSESTEGRFDLKNLNSRCFEGYFQSFLDVDEVREEMVMTLDSVASGRLAENLPDRFLAVHLRRGDYLQSHTLEKHGLVSRTYINNSLIGFGDELSSLPVLVFSDSPEIAKAELGGIDRNLIFIGPESTEAHDVIQIMSRAEGLAISNSSLSWWGAWLATRRTLGSKVHVAAPDKWFADGSSSEFIVPGDWKRYGN